jgi:hypothetical protein
MHYRTMLHAGRRYSRKRDDLSWQALEAVARADKRRDLTGLSPGDSGRQRRSFCWHTADTKSEAFKAAEVTN